MTIEELTPSMAGELVQKLLEDILARGQGFTGEERQLTTGLMALLSAGNARELAEYWRDRGNLELFNLEANSANQRYQLFEQNRPTVRAYVERLAS